MVQVMLYTVQREDGQLWRTVLPPTIDYLCARQFYEMHLSAYACPEQPRPRYRLVSLQLEALVLTVEAVPS